MIRRPPRSTQSRSSAASDVYKRQGCCCDCECDPMTPETLGPISFPAPNGSNNNFPGLVFCTGASGTYFIEYDIANFFFNPLVNPLPPRIAFAAIDDAIFNGTEASPAKLRILVDAIQGNNPNGESDGRITLTHTTAINPIIPPFTVSPVNGTCLLYTSPSPRDRG